MDRTENVTRGDMRRTGVVGASLAVGLAAAFAVGVFVGRGTNSAQAGSPQAATQAATPPAAALGAVQQTVLRAVPAVDGAGHSSAATDWTRYDPHYGSYITTSQDALGRSKVDTDWTRYDPQYGTYGAAPSGGSGQSRSPGAVSPDARGHTSPTTDWSHYDPLYGTWR